MVNIDLLGVMRGRWAGGSVLKSLHSKSLQSQSLLFGILIGSVGFLIESVGIMKLIMIIWIFNVGILIVTHIISLSRVLKSPAPLFD